ncbi:hypothetical protein Aoki45_10210 [Algoriphagus sp. oki45]|uniref:hypothetical protein n=1 Tax=Algoriphagus sp. oki45 TaxID=3067294 RepID=UPI0027FAD1C9|nr:hypothetical protein Aoki45_10210 [Algoriphagus sp. oki45]
MNLNDKETQKAAYQLAGLIYGVSLDGVVNKNEYEALKNWCSTNEPLCENENFQSLYEKIRPIVEDGKVNNEELEEMKNILREFVGDVGSEKLEKPNLYFLSGIFQGILASGDVNTYEIYRLNQWMEKNTHLQEHAPFDELFPLVKSVLEDKKVDNEEAMRLKEFFASHLE